MKKIIITLLLFMFFIPVIKADVIKDKETINLTNNINKVYGTTTGYITTYNTETNTIITSYDLNNSLISQKQINLLNNINIIKTNKYNILVGIAENSYITIYYLDDNLRINNTIETTINTNNLTKIKLYQNNNKIYLLLTTDDYLLIDNYIYEIDENYNINKKLFASYKSNELIDILKSDYYAIKNTYQTINNETYYYKESTYNRNYNILLGQKEDINFVRQNIITTININNETNTFTVKDVVIDMELVNDKLVLLTSNNQLLIYTLDGNLEQEININNGIGLTTISNNLIVYNSNSLNYYEYDCNVIINELPYGTVNISDNIKPYDLVDINVLSNSGYEVENISIIDINGNEIEIIDNQFIMPNKTVYITPSYKASIVNPETADTVFIIVVITLVLLVIWKKVYKKYLWLK